MSNYGPPPGAPQDPSGQPTPPPVYGQPGGRPPTTPPPPPAPGGYGAAPVGYGMAPTPPYAHWGMRLGAWLIDYLLIMASGIVYWVGYGIIIAAGGSSTQYDSATGSYQEPNTGMLVVGGILSLLGGLIMLAFALWNWGFKQGTTGYTIGKGVLGIKVIKEADGQVLGFWLSIGRQFVHMLDSLACYIGWLWPLWDAKRQTFADKILATIVVVEPKQK